MKEKKNPKTIVYVILALLFLTDWVIFPLVLFGGLGYLLFRLMKSSQSPRKPQTRQDPQPAFDECPTGWFCFHRDKGEHHVRRGRDMDPWDRPDIDIRKYQRNR